MKFRVLFLTSVFSIYVISKVDAAQLILSNEIIDYSTDQNFSDNTSYGILADGVTATINTNSNIYVNNNSNSSSAYSIVANNAAHLFINGNDENLFESRNNINNPAMLIENNSKIYMNNINVDFSDNASGIKIGVGSLDIVGSLDGRNKLDIKNTENIAINSEGELPAGNSDIKIKNMDIDLSDTRIVGIQSKNGTVNIESSMLKTNTFKANNIKTESVGVGMGISIYSLGDVTIRNMNIETNNNGFSGIYLTDNGHLNIYGTGKETFSSSENLIGVLNDNNSIVSINDMSLNVSNNSFEGLSATAGAAYIISNSNLLLENNGKNINLDTSGSMFILGESNQKRGNIMMNTSSDSNIYITNQNADTQPIGSELNIENMNITANSGGLISIGNESELSITNSEIYVSDIAFDIQNTALIVLDNVNLSGTNQLVRSKIGTEGDRAGVFGHTTFSATSSKLEGNMFNDSATGQVLDVSLEDVEWRNIGRSNVTSLSLFGTNNIYMNIYFGNSSTQGDLLTIENDGLSLGAENILHITSAGGDGSSADTIVINQETALIPTMTDADFSLANTVDSGFYEYDRLGMDENNNIVLKSNGVMTNTAKTISQFPALHLNIIKTGMNELRKRMGDLRENSPYVSSGAWVRTYAKHLDVNEKIDAKMNLYGMEAGYDYQIYSTCENKAYIGGMAGYLYTDNIKITQKNERHGNGHAKTPSVGIYGTWLNNQGWFADATMRYFWSDMKASNETASGQVISYKPNRDFITGSVEGGKRFEYELNQNEKYIIEPKAEFQYAHARSKSFTTSNNSNIHYGTTESKVLRVGSMFGYEKHLDNGAIIEPYLEISGIQEFAGKTKIEYQGGKTRSDVGGFSIEVGGGINAKLDDNWNIYSDLMYEKGSVVKAISTNIGMRYNW